MNNNVRIARELVKIAKSLVSSSQEMDFYDLISFLDERGWAFHDSFDVKDDEGHTGTRYVLSDYPQNINHIKPISKQEMEKDLKELEKKYENVIPSEQLFKHAPELKWPCVILLD